MTNARNGRIRWTVALLLLAPFAAHGQEYNPASCQAVVNTLNFHWEAVGGPNVPCTGIEFTDGTFADAADGTITMSGVSVSNPSCIGTASYTLTLSADRTTLSGFDTVDNVPLILTRGPGQACFVGHWVSAGHDYLGHIAAAPFLQGSSVAVPALDRLGLTTLAGLLLVAGGVALFRGRRESVGVRSRRR